MAWRQNLEDKDGITLDKDGVPWDGESPDLFKEYKRKIIELAGKAALEDERAKLGLHMLSALTGEAWIAAQSLSLEELAADGNPQRLL